MILYIRIAFRPFSSAVNKALGDRDDVFDRHTIHGEQALIGRRLTELVLNADSLDNALAHFRGNLAHGGAETIENVMILDGDDLALSLIHI